MNHEERILSMLEAVLARQDKTDEQLEAVLARQDKTDERLDAMQASMDQRFESVLAEQKQMNARLDALDGAMVGVREDLTAVKQDAADAKSVVVRIENGHGQKLDALFDGYLQNTDRLNRIQAEVTRHEEVILRRVK